ncbi:MAG: T9SS type A sorting domain-containing protein, partial [Bacteroidales bacterium]|nr:T9SS type A sorting domain-containing protein [Bacteroidales bacterium]
FTGTAESIAEGIYIGEPFPNPFKETTEISYRLNGPAQVRLSLYNSRGQMLGIVMDEQKIPGLHTATIQRNNLSPGVYFFRMEVFIAGEALQKNGKLIISQ